MQKLKLIIKKILLVTPVLNYILIFFRYKIFKTRIKIHGHTSDEMYMSKRNYAIYDKTNIGVVTGVDKDLNYEYSFSKKIIDLANKDKIFLMLGLHMVIIRGLQASYIKRFMLLKVTILNFIT
jgi:hypothetical protein